MCVIKHDLPVYYNPEYNGFHVVHSQDKKNAIIGDCSKFYNDAYTCILRYKIPINYLNKWILLDKDKLITYPFIGKHLLNTIHVHEISDDDDLKRSTWYKNLIIIKNYCI